MEETIINNKKYLTAKRTAYILGCTNDYVSKLCREGKLECLRQDKLWLVEEYSALNYHQSVEVKKSKNRTELAEERAQEYQRSQERLRVQNVQRYIKRVSSLVGIAVMTGLMFFGSQTEIFARTGLAEVAEKVGENISHNFNQAKSVAAVVIGRRVDGVEERYVASIYRAADQIVGAPERFINSVQHVERGIASAGMLSEKVATNVFKKVSNPISSGTRNTASAVSSIGNLYTRGIYAIANFFNRTGEVYTNGIYLVADKITNIASDDFYARQFAGYDNSKNSVITNNVEKKTVIVNGVSEEYLERRLVSFQKSLKIPDAIQIRTRDVNGSNISVDRIYDSIGESSEDAAEDAVTGGSLSFSGINGTFTGNVSVGGALNVTGTTTLSGPLVAGGDAGTNGYVLQTTGTGVQWVATSSLGIVGGGGGTWGSITGTLANQTDLQDALDLKMDSFATGTSAQYLKGDLSLGTFPTTTSAFLNDSGFATGTPWTSEGYLTSFTELDPDFNGWDRSTGISITESQISDLGAYLTAESDPVFSASDVAGVVTADISNWNTAFGWGDHAGAGYLTSYTEADTLAAVTARGATTSDISTFSTAIKTPKLYPSADSTSAFGIFKADGSTNIFNVDSTNSRIGIGTTTPAAALHIETNNGNVESLLRDTSSTGYTSLRLYNNQNNPLRTLEIDYSGSSYSGSLLTGGATGEAAAITTTGSYPLMFGTNNTARMTVTSAGLVGIGTITPSANLSVYAASNATFSVESGGGGGNTATFNFGPWSTRPGGAPNKFVSIDDAAWSAHYTIWTAPPGSPGSSAAVERFRITSSGNVGIGTTAPAVPLQVVGNIYSSGASAGLMFADRTSSQAWQWYGSGSTAILWNGSANLMGVTTGGLMGIGTITPAHSARLDISDGTMTMVLGANSSATTRTNNTTKISRVTGYHYANAEEPVSIFLHSSSATDNIISFGGGTGLGNAATSLNFYTAANTTTTTGTSRMNINSSGFVGIGTTATSLLHLKGNASSANNLLTLTSYANSNTLLNVNTATDNPYLNMNNSSNSSTVYLNTNGSSYFNGGNVGIGTTTPTASLEIAGSSATLQVSQDSGNYIYLSPNSLAMRSSGEYVFSLFDDGWINWEAGGDRSINISSYNQDVLFQYGAMIVENGGNVGIGTTTPDSKLTLAGDFNLTGALKADGDAGTAGYIMQSTGTGVEWVATSSIGFVGGGGPSVWSASGSDIYFNTGNVGIGTTTPAARLHAISTTEQFRLGYDESNYMSATVSSTGDVAFDTVGTSVGFTFNDSVGIGMSPTSASLGVSYGTVQARLGDGMNIAGVFEDGTNTVNLADGNYAVSATGASNFNSSNRIATLAVDGAYAGEFTDLTNYVYLANGTYALTANNSSYGTSANLGGQYYAVEGTITSGGAAGYFNDYSSNSVSIADGSYAINATGESYFSTSVGIGMSPTSAMLGVNYNNVYARLGDAGNIAGVFEDGTNTVNLANGVSAINATGNSYFSNGSSYVDILNPTQGLVLSDGATTLTFLDSGIGEIFNGNFGVGQSVIFGSSVLGQFINGNYTGEIGGSGNAGYFSDTTNTVSMADGTYAINATGDATISGNVGIGTASPQQKLHVVRSDDGAPVRFEDSNGYCEIDPTSTAWSCTSDIRLKENITSLNQTDSLAGILALNPVSFEWKTDESNVQRIGLIAQEVEKIFPDLVNTDRQTGFKSVSYGSFTTYVIGAIQELSKQITELRELVENSTASAVGSITHIIERLTVGSAEKPAGITLFDEVTGEPYCLVVRNGKMVSRPGDCSDIENEGTATSIDDGSGDEGGESGPPPSDDPVDPDPIVDATTTPPVDDGGDTGTPTPDVTTTPDPVVDVTTPPPADDTTDPTPVVDPAPEVTPTETAPAPEPEPASDPAPDESTPATE